MPHESVGVDAEPHAMAMSRARVTATKSPSVLEQNAAFTVDSRAYGESEDVCSL